MDAVLICKLQKMIDDLFVGLLYNYWIRKAVDF